jgi:hypothetical protein
MWAFFLANSSTFGESMLGMLETTRVRATTAAVAAIIVALGMLKPADCLHIGTAIGKQGRRVANTQVKKI